MAGYIPENTLDEILNKIDIVELIAGYFPLKRAGRNFKALCPFHHEKTPSFMVNPQRQIFHCFGCGKGGNAFGFLMAYERMDFLEVVKTMSEKTGVLLPQQASTTKADTIISNLYKINEFARSFYQDTLSSPAGISTRQYLDKRNMKPGTTRLFGLGLSQDKWDGLFNYLRIKNIGLTLLEKSGLFCSRESGGYYDRFRNRLIFPILDVKNRVVAFGARRLSEDSALSKYINSPESLIYIKGKHLYGLNLAHEAIRQDDSAIVVEGYFDCISVYQAGIKNVVASLGTSLTLEQIRLLKRYTHNIIMVYDSDQAGQEATLRSLDIFIQEAMNVRVALMPVNSDPDSFLQEFGSAALRDIIANAKGLFDYKLGVLTSRYDMTKPEGKANIAKEMLSSLSNFPDAVLQSEYVRRLAHILDIKEEVLIIELRKMKDKRIPQTSSLLTREIPLKINPTERLLISLILKETTLIPRLRAVLYPDDFQDPRIARVFSLICELLSQGKDIQPNRLIGYLNDEESACLVTGLLAADDFVQADTEEVLNDCVTRIKKQRLNSKCQSLQRQIKMAQEQCDQEQLNRLVAELRDLRRLGT